MYQILSKFVYFVDFGLLTTCEYFLTLTSESLQIGHYKFLKTTCQEKNTLFSKGDTMSIHFV